MKDRILNGLLLVATLFLTGIRFFYLDADFPANLTDSGYLYTDEGWYSIGAVRQILTGHWYMAGDFNPAVNLPVPHIAKYLFFCLSGISIHSNRLITLVFFIILMISTWFFLKGFLTESRRLLLLTLLSGNYLLFAYSRSSSLEIMMLAFIMVSLALIDTRSRMLILAAGMVLCAALLTKTTALFAIPVAYFVIYIHHFKKKLLIPMVLFNLGLWIPFLCYNVWALSTYPDDYKYFFEINMENRLELTFLSLSKSALRLINQIRYIGEFYYFIPVMLLLTTIIRYKSIQFSKLTQISIIWIIAYSTILAVSSYHPTRYFIPYVIPFSIIFIDLLKQFEPWPKLISRTVITILLLIFLTTEIVPIAKYLNKPRYSFITMLEDAKANLARPDSIGEIVVIGNFSNTLNLHAPIVSVNSKLGTESLNWKLINYEPDYWIGLDGDSSSSVFKTYHFTELAKWNVFNNYIDGQKVQLLQMNSNHTSDSKNTIQD